jgi:hypothetical protein
MISKPGRGEEPVNALASPPTQSANRRPIPRRVLVPTLAVAAAVTGVALWAFQPWRLFTSTTVHEALPGASSATAPGASPNHATPSGSSPAESATSTDAGPASPVTLATGTFITHEHRTTGRVAVVRLSDGGRVVRLENLDTSNGPDLHIWLSDQPVRSGSAGWTVFDDGAYLDLGSLKGNKGDQNYPLPEGADLSKFTSVSVWCARFHVSFGAATLTPA